MISKISKVSQLTYQTFNTTYAHFRMSALMLQLSQQTLVPSSLIPCKTRVNPQLNYAKTEKNWLKWSIPKRKIFDTFKWEEKSEDNGKEWERVSENSLCLSLSLIVRSCRARTYQSKFVTLSGIMSYGYSNCTTWMMEYWARQASRCLSWFA